MWLGKTAPTNDHKFTFGSSSSFGLSWLLDYCEAGEQSKESATENVMEWDDENEQST